MPGVHWVIVCSTALSRGSFMLLIQLSPSHSINMLGHTALSIQHSVTWSLCLPTWWGGVFFSRLCFAQDIVDSAWLVGIKPDDSFNGSWVSGWWIYLNLFKQSVLLLDHTWVRCLQLPTSNLNQGVRITPFWTKQSKTLSIVLILSSWALLAHQNWMHPSMRLMPCLFQSLQGFWTQYHFWKF